MNLVTEGIVVRDVSYKDNSKILTVLTTDLGKISVNARGAKKMKSPLFAVSNMFCYARFELFKYKDKYNLNGAQLIESFFELRNDIEKLSLAQYLCDIANYISTFDENCKTLLSLLSNCLYLLAKKDKSILLIKSIFEIHSAIYSGYLPDLETCNVCSSQTDKYYFNFYDGSVKCPNCEDKTAENILLTGNLLTVFRYLIKLPLEKAVNLNISNTLLKEISTVTEKYISTQFDKSFETLKFFKSVYNPV